MVEPEQMQNTVDGVECDFLPGCPVVLPRLAAGDFGADQNFAVLEGDDVGIRIVIQEFTMHARQGRPGEETDFDPGREPRLLARRQEGENPLKPAL
jgi:hypothetical protein